MERGEKAQPGIALRGLRRDFDEVPALHDLSIALPRGETLIVLGPNGSGKTTLLRLLAGLLRPSAGEARVLGRELPREAWRLRGRVGYLGHEPLLYRDLTVRENLLFHARLHGLERPHERMAALLERVAMSRRVEERVQSLSAGMLQRVAVCRAVLHDPELLLLDEPLTHLDPEGAGLVEPLLAAAPGRTRVLVSHDPRAGVAGGGRILALTHGGSVAYEGPASGFAPERAGAIYAGEPV